MNMMDELTRLLGRVRKLENNRGASLRFAKVTSVSEDGHARVELLDGEGMVSHPLRILQPRTLKDKYQHFPDVGEQVACLFSGQGLESGVILGAVYSRTDQSAGQKTHMAYTEFEDGTRFSFDREKTLAEAEFPDGTTLSYDGLLHKLKARVMGSVEVSAALTAQVEALLGITASTPMRLVLEGGAGIYMRAPRIRLEGYRGSALCDADIEADIRVKGRIEHEGPHIQNGPSSRSGSLNQSGPMGLTGQLTHQGDLKQIGSQRVSGDITAEGTVTGSPVKGCEH